MIANALLITIAVMRGNGVDSYGRTQVFHSFQGCHLPLQATGRACLLTGRLRMLAGELARSGCVANRRTAARRDCQDTGRFDPDSLVSPLLAEDC